MFSIIFWFDLKILCNGSMIVFNFREGYLDLCSNLITFILLKSQNSKPGWNGSGSFLFKMPWEAKVFIYIPPCSQDWSVLSTETETSHLTKVKILKDVWIHEQSGTVLLLFHIIRIYWTSSLLRSLEGNEPEPEMMTCFQNKMHIAIVLNCGVLLI